MAIKRYLASADNTITNAFKENLSTRGTDANMGAADSLEVFSIYGQASTSSVEKSRILVHGQIQLLMKHLLLFLTLIQEQHTNGKFNQTVEMETYQHGVV